MMVRDTIIFPISRCFAVRND